MTITPYPKIAKRRRHIFTNGTVIFIRPSLITETFDDFNRESPHCFRYFFDGNWMTVGFDTPEQAEYERKRLVAYAGGDVMPPEMR